MSERCPTCRNELAYEIDGDKRAYFCLVCPHEITPQGKWAAVQEWIGSGPCDSDRCRDELLKPFAKLAAKLRSERQIGESRVVSDTLLGVAEDIDAVIEKLRSGK